MGRNTIKIIKKKKDELKNKETMEGNKERRKAGRN
jgi:hypothetical protein